MKFEKRSVIVILFILYSPVMLVSAADNKFQNLYAEKYRPPNVVLILFDWARRDAIGVYSDKPVSTPNIDKLANNGVRFNNAYTTATLCSPARASLITGLYPHAHGVRKTMYPAGINGELPTMYKKPIANPFNEPEFNLAINFPKYITNSGFATAHIGKWHLGIGNPGFFDLFKSYNSLMPHWVGTPNIQHTVKTCRRMKVFVLSSKIPTDHFSYTSPITHLMGLTSHRKNISICTMTGTSITRSTTPR